MKIDTPSTGNAPIAGLYAVVLVDVLGQEDAISKLPLLPDETATLEDLHPAIRDSLGTRDFVRLQLEQIYYETLQPPTSSDLNSVPLTMGQAAVDFLSQAKLRTYMFSDTLVHFLRFPLREPLVALATLASLITAAGTSMLLCISNGIAVRGAIEVGFGFELPNEEIYGPVYVRAHRMEKGAGYPRIVVSEAIHKFLAELTIKPPSDPIKDSLSESCHQMITRDTDGLLVVDYVSTYFRDNLTNFPQYIADAKSFVNAQVEIFSKTKTEKAEKLKPRYENLLRFLNRGDNA